MSHLPLSSRPPSSSPSLPPQRNHLSHTPVPRKLFRFFWCELESWKWSSLLDRIKVEHRDEEGRYPAGVFGTTEFFLVLILIIM